MKRNIVCTIIGIMLCSNCVVAQVKDSNLEVEVRETINQQCLHKVKALTDHFTKIATKVEADSIKDYHIEACLDLFIGRGNDINDEEGNVIFPAPRIEVSSLSTGRKNSYFVKNYLVRLKGLQYSKIVFKTSSCYIAEGGIKKISENQYSAVVSFYQVFIGYKGDMKVYSDKTKKSVKVIIEKDNLGRFDVLLGDITADETKPTE